MSAKIEPIVAYMMEQDIIEKRKKLKFTVLHRPGGVWHGLEIGRIVNGLMTEIYQLPALPEYAIVYGHYTKARILEVMLGGIAFTATEHTGLEGLPFKPGGF